MSTILGTTVHPLSNLSPVIGELAASRISQMPAYRAAQTAAPIVSRATRKGTYVRDQTYRGLDLSRAPGSVTPASLAATQYPSAGMAYNTDDYEIVRYIVDSQDVPDAELADWLAVAGVSVEDRVASVFADRIAAVHDYNVWQTLGATSGGFTAADPGNITTASFNFISAMDTAIQTLVKAQRYTRGAEIDIFVADDVYPYIQVLDQVRGRIVSGMSASSTVATPDAVGAFFADYCPGARVHRVQSYYTASSGTVTASLSGKILYQPARPGWDRSALTIAPQGDGGGVAVASVRSERIEAMPGTRLYADGHMDVKIVDSAGAYLMHGLLS